MYSKEFLASLQIAAVFLIFLLFSHFLNICFLTNVFLIRNIINFFFIRKRYLNRNDKIKSYVEKVRLSKCINNSWITQVINNVVDSIVSLIGIDCPRVLNKK